MELIGQHDGSGFARRGREVGQVFRLALSPGTLLANGIEFSLGTEFDELGDLPTELDRDLSQSDGSVFDDIMKQGGGYYRFVEPEPSQDESYGGGMLEIGVIGTLTELFAVGVRGASEGAFDHWGDQRRRNARRFRGRERADRAQWRTAPRARTNRMT